MGEGAGGRGLFCPHPLAPYPRYAGEGEPGNSPSPFMGAGAGGRGLFCPPSPSPLPPLRGRRGTGQLPLALYGSGGRGERVVLPPSPSPLPHRGEKGNRATPPRPFNGKTSATPTNAPDLPTLHLHQTLYHSIIAPLFKTRQDNHAAEHKELEGERSNTYDKPTEATRKAGSPAPKGIIWYLSPPYGPLPHSQQVNDPRQKGRRLVRASRC